MRFREVNLAQGFGGVRRVTGSWLMKRNVTFVRILASEGV